MAPLVNFWCRVGGADTTRLLGADAGAGCNPASWVLDQPRSLGITESSSRVA